MERKPDDVEPCQFSCGVGALRFITPVFGPAWSGGHLPYRGNGSSWPCVPSWEKKEHRDRTKIGLSCTDIAKLNGVFNFA